MGGARRIPLPGFAQDAALAAGAGAFSMIATPAIAHHDPGSYRSLDALAWVLLALAPILLLGRRRMPLATLGATAALSVVFAARNYPNGPGPCVSAFIALVTVAALLPVGAALLSGAAILLAEEVARVAIAGQPLLSSDGLTPFVWITIALLAGLTIRSQRAYAEEIGRTRAEEARRMVGEERLRIARELHDVLAHSLALIHVQASTAAHVAARRPEQVEDALLAIKQASQEALADLRTTVGVLRASAEDDAARAPQPSLARIEELTSAAERAGLAVDLRAEGAPRRLPAPVDVAGYRIVQEALTNVVRHAGAAAVRVGVAYTDDGVVLEIEDDGRGAGPNGSAASPGHGIAGMRERAELLGGSMAAGTCARGGFRVRAELPAPAPAAFEPEPAVSR